jgi:hypothetical protein
VDGTGRPPSPRFAFNRQEVLWQRRESKAAADNENYVNWPERKRS